MRARLSFVQAFMYGTGAFAAVTAAFVVATSIAISGPPTASEANSLESAVDTAATSLQHAARRFGAGVCRRIPDLGKLGACPERAALVAHHTPPHPHEAAPQLAEAPAPLPPDDASLSAPLNAAPPPVHARETHADLLGAGSQPHHAVQAHAPRIEHAQLTPRRPVRLARAAAREHVAAAPQRRAHQTLVVAHTTATPSHRAPHSVPASTHQPLHVAPATRTHAPVATQIAAHVTPPPVGGAQPLHVSQPVLRQTDAPAREESASASQIAAAPVREPHVARDDGAAPAPAGNDTQDVKK